eukprot:765400-Hanusia_phi.AAC.2
MHQHISNFTATSASNGEVGPMSLSLRYPILPPGLLAVKARGTEGESVAPSRAFASILTALAKPGLLTSSSIAPAPR